MNPNIPREKIIWYPTINYDTCIGDRACLDFCRNDVFVWDDEKDRPAVIGC